MPSTNEDVAGAAAAEAADKAVETALEPRTAPAPDETIGETIARMRGEDGTGGASGRDGAPESGGASEREDAFDPELLSWAKDAGLDESEARAFEKPEHLERHLRHHDRRVREYGESYMSSAGKGSDRGQQPESRQDPAAPEREPGRRDPAPLAHQNSDYSFRRYEFKVDDEFSDEAAAKRLNEMSALVNTQLEQLRAAVVELAVSDARRRGGEMEQARSVHLSALDEFVSGLGKEWHDEFGDAPASETLLKRPDTPQGKAIRKLAEAYDQLLYGRALMNGGTPAVATRDEAMLLLRRAAASVYHDRFKRIARRELEGALKKRAQAAMGEPSGRVDAETKENGDPMKPRKDETEAQWIARVSASLDRKRGLSPRITSLS